MDLPEESASNNGAPAASGDVLRFHVPQEDCVQGSKRRKDPEAITKPITERIPSRTLGGRQQIDRAILFMQGFTFRDAYAAVASSGNCSQTSGGERVYERPGRSPGYFFNFHQLPGRSALWVVPGSDADYSINFLTFIFSRPVLVNLAETTGLGGLLALPLLSLCHLTLPYPLTQPP